MRLRYGLDAKLSILTKLASEQNRKLTKISRRSINYSQSGCYYMGGLIGEGLAEYRIGQAAGAKGLPEGFARLFGHHILAVIPWHQHHDMAGALPACVTAMDFSWRILVVRVAHKGAREENERPSYSSPLGSQSFRSNLFLGLFYR